MTRTLAVVAASIAAVAMLAIATPQSSAPTSPGHPTAAELERGLSGPDAGPGTARSAFEACRSIAAAFDGRDAARFLDQYGRAAARTGEPEIAAVMFARGFLLHPASRWAPSSLLESATLHRHVFGDEAVAQRLARRSIATARALAMLDEVAAAEAFLAKSPGDGPVPNPTPDSRHGSPTNRDPTP